jgi:hypothetical protein
MITRGLRELRSRARVPPGRVRRPGTGRKRTIDEDPTLCLHRDLELIEGLGAGEAGPEVAGPIEDVGHGDGAFPVLVEDVDHRISHNWCGTVERRRGSLKAPRIDGIPRPAG